MPGTKLKPPITGNKSIKVKQPPKLLSNAEYDEIFNAVINNVEPPIIETSSNQNRRKKITTFEKSEHEFVISSNISKQNHSESMNYSSVSTLHSDDLKEEAIHSTPVLNISSYRSAVETLKNKVSQTDESASENMLDSSIITDLVPLSQPPKNLNHLNRLLWLQNRRGGNIYIQCDECDKWRLTNLSDPLDAPDIWYCHMNIDPFINKCSYPEVKLTLFVEEDLIENKFTAGSVVWAKIHGYPWWPAMVDDDPDTEQFYWIEDYNYNVPTSYNVTFFDGKNKPVTRGWILLKNLLSFKHNIDLDKKNTSSKYKYRLKYAKQQAFDAITLPIRERLQKYSFIVKTTKKINTPISTPPSSENEQNELNTCKSIKKIVKRRNTLANTTGQLQSCVLQEIKKEKKILKRRYTVNEVEDSQQQKETKRTKYTKSEDPQKSEENIFKESKLSVVSEMYSQIDTFHNLNASKSIMKRRNTHRDETQYVYSQDSEAANCKTIIRENDGKIPNEIDQNAPNVNRENQVIRRRNSVHFKVPKNVIERRNTVVVVAGIECNSTKENEITKHRTIGEPMITEIAESNKIKTKTNTETNNNKSKIKSCRMLVHENNSQPDTLENLNAPKRTINRRYSLRSEDPRSSHVLDKFDGSLNNSRESKKDSQHLQVLKKISKRRNTRAECQSSNELKNEKKISKLHLTTAVDHTDQILHSEDTIKSKNDSQDTIKCKNDAQNNKQGSKRDSQHLHPKKIANRRNTRAEYQSSYVTKKLKKITNRRVTTAIDHEDQILYSEKKEYSEDSVKSEIDAQNIKLKSKQDLHHLPEPKKIANRRNTRAEFQSSYERKEVKKITNRRLTTAIDREDQILHSEKKEHSEDSVKSEIGAQNIKLKSKQDLHHLPEPKKIANRRNTRAEFQSSYERKEVKKITNRRLTTAIDREDQILHSEKKEHSEDSVKSEIDAQNIKLKSKQDLHHLPEPKKIANRRNTRAELQSSYEPKQVKKITNRRLTTTFDHEDLILHSEEKEYSEDSVKAEIDARNSKLKSKQDLHHLPEPKKITNRRNTRAEFQSSFEPKEVKKITNRRLTTTFDHEDQILHSEEKEYSEDSVKYDIVAQNINLEFKQNLHHLLANRRNTRAECQSSYEPKKVKKITNRRVTTAIDHEDQILPSEEKEYSEDSVKSDIVAQNIKLKSKQDLHHLPEPKKIANRRNTRAEFQSSYEPKKVKKITNRRVTTAFDHEDQILHSDDFENNVDIQQNSKEYNLKRSKELKILKCGEFENTNKRINKFVSPFQIVKILDGSISENNSDNKVNNAESKKSKRTLGTRKIVSVPSTGKDIKNTDSGYISAHSSSNSIDANKISDSSKKTDAGESKRTTKKDLSTILEESCSMMSDLEEKIDEKKNTKQTDEDQVDDNFKSFCHSLEQMDEAKRKKKLTKIYKEIFILDKDTPDPKVPETHKYFEQILSSLKKVEIDKSAEDGKEKLQNKLNTLKTKIVKGKSKEIQNISNQTIINNKNIFKPSVKSNSTSTSSDTSTNYSDSSDNEFKNAKKKNCFKQ